MIKNRIRLTEAQLHKVIKESVRRVLRENRDEEIRHGRFKGLSDAIDFYTYLNIERGKLSDEQLKDLKNCRDTIVVFGELGLKYALSANETLKENGYDDKFSELYTEK